MDYEIEYDWDDENLGEVDFETSLNGVILQDVSINADRDQVWFRTIDDKRFVMYHQQDCCEYVIIEDWEGDLQDLIGEPLTVSETTNDNSPPTDNDCDESHTWTFYNLRTRKGNVNIRWLGQSNGYYSETVSLVRTK